MVRPQLAVLSFGIESQKIIFLTFSLIDHGQTQAKTCLSPQALIELYVHDPTGQGSQPAIYKRSLDVGAGGGTVLDETVLKRAERSEDSHESHEAMPGENLAGVKITPNIFMSMCPALLVQIEQGSCNEQTKTEADDPQRSTIGMQAMRH